MRKVTKQEWVDALRSGDYQQAQGRLKGRRKRTFCCLGVLADLTGCSWGSDNYPVVNGEYGMSCALLFNSFNAYLDFELPT